MNNFPIVVSVTESAQSPSCYFNRGSKKVLGVLTSKSHIVIRVMEVVQVSVMLQITQTYRDSATVSTVLVSCYIEKEKLKLE